MSDNVRTKRIPYADWAKGTLPWKGDILGRTIDSDVCILSYVTDETGAGPDWHVHPYDEIFIIRQGRARFTVGDTVIEAGVGDVVLGPANIPHKYRNIGEGRLESTDIHLSREWIQTDLDDPDAD